MTKTKGAALSLTVMLAGALASASGPAGSPAVGPRLTAISSRVHPAGAELVIEATAPVAYVTTRPEPTIVWVDFRNVVADGLANSVAPRAGSPISAVAVEATESLGAPTSRVRITLAQPVAYRIRSDRNTIVLDFEKPSGVDRGRVSDPLLAGARPLSPSPAATPLPFVPDAMKALEQAPAIKPVAIAMPPESSAALSPASLPQGHFTENKPPAQAPPPPPPPAAVQPAAATPGSVQLQQPSQGRRYTGNPISLDFQGADLRSVLRVFAEESGLNIVIDPAVAGTVDVALRDVPWDQAMDIVLRSNKLGFIVDGTIVRIAPLTVLADEETQRRKLSEEQALAGELRVLTKTLSYAKAEELSPLITKSALSQRGTVQVDPRTNTLIITDLPDRLTLASDLIGNLDKPQPQVEIEARIVQANKNYARAIGVQWGFMGRVSPALGNTTSLAFPNQGSLTGRTGSTQGPTGDATAAQPTGVNLGVPAATSAVGLALGSVNGAFNLDLALSAAESSGNLRVLSTPRVTTQNNGEADIMQGVQIPIQTVANNTVTVQFKDAALTLKVTPQITSAGTVIMKIVLENAQADFSRAVNGIPPINTQRANTTVLINDGQTTVIGGIYVSQEQSANDKTPGLSRVPLLGWLFKRDSVTDQSTELLIFITPRIVKA